MGNCQASDSVAAVIQHPDGRLETAYWPLSATQVMASNPGHYVAVITTVTHSRSSSSDRRRSSRGDNGGGGNSVRYLKLLRPEDTLLVGHFYRLVSFEGQLSKLLAKKKGEVRKQCDEANSSSVVASEEGETTEEVVRTCGSDSVDGENNNRVSRHGYWRPTLQTIAEAGSFKY
ncbi:hypothetical protein BHE74_00039434 [Ensete ventricosum]|uniref:Uncharacterized protein n=1 Tax=Ensete ventricosum TaxID=4639 RepID=A0A426ZIU3_ENSVE|nr:hypothetical protein B296_00028513 [Ensete ventricosum]RWW54030.1 hypothetical protein BHE74_00039434 [Ensete ventricosum]RZS01493.1 hypothetical protein BHM03_00031360 [Ensete ventricosum]